VIAAVVLHVLAAVLAIAAGGLFCLVARIAWLFRRVAREADTEQTRHTARMGWVACLVFLCVLLQTGARLVHELAVRVTPPTTAEAPP
jgi:hypothetical protein